MSGVGNVKAIGGENLLEPNVGQIAGAEVVMVRCWDFVLKPLEGVEQRSVKVTFVLLRGG